MARANTPAVSHHELRPGALLREATRDDVPGIQRVRHAVRENRLVSRVIGDGEVIDQIERTGRGFVVTVDGDVVAFAIGNASNGNLWALFVDPPHEGRGFGRALHDATIAWLASRGVTELWLTTTPGTRAARFYPLAGWTLAGEVDGELRFVRKEPAGGTMTTDTERAMGKDEREIHDLVTTWLDATRQGDVDTLMTLVCDDVVFLRPGHPPMTRDAFEQQLRAQSAPDRPAIEMTHHFDEIVVDGDHAYVTASLAVAVTPRDGQPVRRAGHVLSVLRREEGRWKFARDANLLAAIDDAHTDG